MNKINEKKHSKKITIMLLIVILFNFVVPNVSHAGVLLNAFSNLLLVVPDNLMVGLHEIFLGETDIKDDTGSYSIKFGPGTIFSGKIPAFSINFIDSDGGESELTPIYDTNEWHYNEIDTTYYGYYGAPATLGQRLVEILYSIGYIDDENYYILSVENYLSSFQTSEQILDTYGSTAEKKDLERTYEIRTDNTDNNAYIIIKCKLRWFSDNDCYSIYEYTIDGSQNVLRVVNQMSSPASELRTMIASWYKVMQELALLGLLSVLVYIAIRMILSSVARRKSKI